MRDTAERIVLPVGNDTTLRISYELLARHLDADLYRGKWPNGTRLVFAIGDDSDSTRVDTDRFGNHGLWIGGTWFQVSATAARRIRVWLDRHGIGQPAPAAEGGATDALDSLTLNIDTPAPVAPGGAA